MQAPLQSAGVEEGEARALNSEEEGEATDEAG
jgi:hypothetical protein